MAIRYKTEEITVVDKVLCDVCGMDCSKEYAKLSANWGHNSANHGTVFFIQICEKCFYEILRYIRQARNPSIFTKAKDPLEGSELNIDNKENWMIRFDWVDSQLNDAKLAY